MRLDHLLSKEHTLARWAFVLPALWVLASGTVDVGPLLVGAVVASTTRPLLWGVGVGRPVVSGWWGMEMARCWALRNQALCTDVCGCWLSCGCLVVG